MTQLHAQPKSAKRTAGHHTFLRSATLIFAVLCLAIQPLSSTITSALVDIVNLPYTKGLVIKNCGTMQGGASDGTNLYVACASPSKSTVRILKLDANGKELANESYSRSEIGHANDMAYNSKLKVLVVPTWDTDGSGEDKAKLLDPDTLKVKDTVKTSDGGGLSNICYNAAADQYVAGGRVYDGSFNYVKRIYTNEDVDKDTRLTSPSGTVLNQGIDCDSQYIYVMRVLFKQTGYNRIAVYDWSGKNVAVYQVSLNDEGESLSVINGVMYMGINEGSMSGGGDTGDDYFVKLNVPQVGGSCNGSNYTSDFSNAYKAKNNAPYSASATCCSTATASSDLSQAPTGAAGKVTEALLKFLTGKGFTLAQAAGVAGNVQQESGFSTTAKNAKSGAFGLFQWLGGRYDGLVKYAAQNNLPVSDVNAQLGWMWTELNSSEKATLVALASNNNATPEEAAVTWSVKFERAGKAESNDTKRQDNARAIYNAYKGSIPDGSGIKIDSTTTSSSSVAAASGTASTTNCQENTTSNGAVGGFALPVDQKFFDAHEEWFTKPHHDYPASDIPVPTGTNIYAVTDGKVTSGPTGGSCGVGIVVQASDGTRYIYCHGSDGGSVSSATLGSTVKAGQLIMHSASTGHSTGPHLHLGINLPNGTKVCPQKLLDAIGKKQTPPAVSSLPTSGCTYSSGGTL